MSDVMNLRVAQHPAAPEASVKLFQDSVAATTHMRDHLLSQPECHAWGTLEPGLGQLVNLQNPGARWKFASGTGSTDNANAERLYSLYCDAVERNLEDAGWLGWHASAGQVTVVLGLDGVLSVIAGDTLRTAFLPGQGSSDAVKRSRQESCSDNELPREVAFSRRSSRRRKKSGLPWGLEAKRTPEERLYYEVFRPAVKFIRKCHYHDGKVCPVDSGNQYGLLKKCLPGMKALSLKNWTEMRSSARMVAKIAS